MKWRTFGILLGIALFAVELAFAEAGDPTRPEEESTERNPRFWTGVGLLAGGVALTVAGAAGWDSNHMNGAYSDWRMMPTPSAWRGPNPGGSFVPPGYDGFARSEGNTGDVVMMAVGASAATVGLVLVLTSKGESRPKRSLTLLGGLGWFEVGYSF